MLVFLICVGLAWFFILFLHTLFKTCMLHPYLRIHASLGLDIQPFIIYWRTTRFNPAIYRMSYKCPSFIRSWFNIGAYTTCFIYVPCVMLFIRTAIDIIKYFFAVEDVTNDMLVVPVIPGINLPSSRVLMYLMAILVCSVLHEFGHALAASRERISIEVCGFAVYGLFPLAFVNVRSDQFRILSKWQQMRILCAGIWHNIIISLSACLLLLMFSVLMFPLYYTGSGVSVVKVHEQSGLNHVAGLAAGDRIYKFGNCEVKDMESWLRCIEKSRVLTGLCVPKYLLNDFDYKDMVNCSSALDSLYFKVQGPEAVLGTCLKARTAVSDFVSCYETAMCQKTLHCSFPVLEKNQIFTSITRQDKPLVLYVGSIDELKIDVTVSGLLPRSKFIPTTFAQTLKEFLEYLLMFSFGLAWFNMIPAFGLDGEYIVETFIHAFFSSYLPRLGQRIYLFVWIKRISSIFVIWWFLTVTLIYVKEHLI